MDNTLKQIVENKKQELEKSKLDLPIDILESRVPMLPPCRDFEAALRNCADPVAVIAEVKKASPTAGVFRPDYDPVDIAKSYQASGAAAISVVTDEKFFQGSLESLGLIRKAVNLPILRKDFILDRYQLLEARMSGADCILLIAEVLSGALLQELYLEARKMGLHVLIELHDKENISRVVDTGCSMIGINNRDLKTFQTNIQHSIQLSVDIPKDRVIVSESGIQSAVEIGLLQAAGIRAALIGELLLRSPDISKSLSDLRTITQA